VNRQKKTREVFELIHKQSNYKKKIISIYIAKNFIQPSCICEILDKVSEGKVGGGIG
jgi:hypothetical protein